MNKNKFGFDFGSMTVTRTCQDHKASIISVATKKAKFSIRATNNGSIRFFDDMYYEFRNINHQHNRG